MIFNLSSSRSICTEDSSLVNDLKEIGVKFSYYKHDKKEYAAIDDDQKIEINTLEQLIDFIEKFGQLVISKCFLSDADDFEIEIYNDYRE